jgi:lipopolysaccharide heptosyltransferase II
MKILIIRLSSLGDIILTQPVCALLLRAYPNAEIHYICKPAFAQLPEMFETPVKVIPYEKSIAFHHRLRQTKYDVVIDLHGKLASMLLSLVLKATIKLSYNKQRSTRKAIVRGNHKQSIDSTVQLYVSSLKKLGIDTGWEYPRLRELPSRTQESNATDKQISALPIAIFPGATHFTKRYPVKSWIEFVNLNPQYHFALFGSKTDIDTCDYIVSGANASCTSYAGKYNFNELLIELKQCRLVISGDTGPMHLAAAIKLPQIAIFGGTHPRLGFRPLNELARVLCAELPCQPCSLHGEKQCPLGHFDCMKLISPAMLSTTLRETLSI